MSGKTDLLNSHYIIDGVQMPYSPGMMLRECLSDPSSLPESQAAVLADERKDPAPSDRPYDEAHIDAYARQVEALPKRELPLSFAGSYSAAKVAQGLIDAIWMGGHFRLPDLSLKADWKWNARGIGLPAAFYDSVEKACGYIDALGIKIEKFGFSSGAPAVSFKATTAAELEEDDFSEEESLLRDLPYRTVNPRMTRRRKASASLVPEPKDWILYIPFDPCDFRDCYEVVRELVEDGIVKAGVTVGDGGLLTALRSMAGATGADVSIQDISKAYGEENPVRVLFGEVPGVIVQIADIDYDYVDAELILQDVVYYPIGHPAPGKPGVRLTGKVEIPQILESLLNTLEGED